MNTKQKIPRPRWITEKTKKLLTDWMIEPKYTRNQLLDKILEEIPEIRRSTAATWLSRGKNPKYSKFTNKNGDQILIKVTEDKKLFLPKYY